MFLAAADWTEIGGICALVALVFSAGAYGGKGVNLLRVNQAKKKANVNASNQDILDAIRQLTGQNNEVRVALNGRDKTTFEPDPPPGLIGTVEQHIVDDGEKWDQIAVSLDEIHKGQAQATENIITGVTEKAAEVAADTLRKNGHT